MNQPSIWWRAESANSACDFPVGKSAVDIGAPTYRAETFGKGVYSNSDSNGARITETGTQLFNPDKFMLSCYVRTDYAMADGLSPAYYTLMNYSNNPNWMSIGFYTSPYGIYFAGNQGAWDYRGTGVTWNADTKNHFVLRYDRAGDLGGGKHFQIFVNGTEVYSSTVQKPSMAGVTNGILTLLGFSSNGIDFFENFGGSIDNLMIFAETDQSQSEIEWLRDNESWVMVTHPNQLLIDNIIIGNFEKVAFADRFWEDETGDIKDLEASEGIFPDHVHLSWDDINLGIAGNCKYEIFRDGVLLAETTAIFYDDYAAQAGVRHAYKIRSTNDGADGTFTDEVLGWLVYSTYYRTVSKKFIEDGKPHVFMINYNNDLYAEGRLIEFPIVTEEKTFGRDKIISNEMVLRVRNDDNYFSVNNRKSPFGSHPWKYAKLLVYNFQGDLIWDGLIVDIKRIHEGKVAEITSQDSLAQFLSKRLLYTSADWETPADAVLNIFAAVGITNYNNTSLNRAKKKYVAGGCYIKCDFSQGDAITVLGALERLGEFGVADCFFSRNTFFFSHNVVFESRKIPKILVDSDFMEAPTVSFGQSDMKNEYAIRYVGDAEVAATDVANGNIGASSRNLYGTQDVSEINGAENQQIMIRDKTAAVYIGECYIRRTHLNLGNNPMPPQWVDFTVDIRHRNDLDVNSYFRMTYADEDWNEKLCEIFMIEKNEDANYIRVTALEVQE